MDAKVTQPRALRFLFLTELWERFGFYVVQGLLILYLTGYFDYSDSESYTILGVFTAFAYISPLAGGYIASRILGYKTTIIIGGILLTLGYLLLALPYGRALLHPALATIIAGNGLFKPNISSLLGLQYETNDARRDAGFTLFYIGINIGILLAGLTSGYIKEYFGWRVSFGLPAIGLIIGIATFISGFKNIKTPPHSEKPLTVSLVFRIVCYCLLAIIALVFLQKIEMFAEWLLPAVGVVLLAYLIVLTVQQTAEYKRSMLVLNILIVSSVIFWTLFLQMFYSANLFVERLVEKDIGSLHLTTTVFYASEAIFIIILGPLFAILWQKLDHIKKNPSPVLKFSLGVFCAGLGFIVLAISTNFLNANGLIPPYWIFGAYLFITTGELLLSPIGLSAVTSLAPPRLVGTMMGVWFVALGFGGIFAGMLAQLADVPESADVLSEGLKIYHTAFLNYAYIGFFVAILLFFLNLSLSQRHKSPDTIAPNK